MTAQKADGLPGTKGTFSEQASGVGAAIRGGRTRILAGNTLVARPQTFSRAAVPSTSSRCQQAIRGLNRLHRAGTSSSLPVVWLSQGGGVPVGGMSSATHIPGDIIAQGGGESSISSHKGDVTPRIAAIKGSTLYSTKMASDERAFRDHSLSVWLRSRLSP